MAITAAAEVSAAATVVQFWNTSINVAAWITPIAVLIVVINFCGVRLYGEVCISRPKHATKNPKLTPLCPD